MRPNLSKTLFRLNPTFPHQCQRHIHSLPQGVPISYKPLKKNLSQEELIETSSAFKDAANLNKNGLGRNIDFANHGVFKVATPDIQLSPRDKFGSMLVLSNKGSVVKYGKYGIAPSSIIKPQELLTNILDIPPNSFGFLTLEQQVPFSLDHNDPTNSFACSYAHVEKVCEHDENISRYSLTKVSDLPAETSIILSLRLQQAIFENKKNEYFYEEVTSRVYSPTRHNRSSGTLMNFKPVAGKTTTQSHYHPGPRSLHIYTTDEEAGAILNFCGIAENPENRKDCEVQLEFPKNSLVILNFASFVHHRFKGRFAALSVHPEEEKNLIQATQSGTLPRGFLETATVFSGAEQKWRLSTPADSIEKDLQYRS